MIVYRRQFPTGVIVEKELLVLHIFALLVQMSLIEDIGTHKQCALSRTGLATCARRNYFAAQRPSHCGPISTTASDTDHGRNHELE